MGTDVSIRKGALCDGPTPPPTLRFAAGHLPRYAVEDIGELLHRETGELAAKPTGGASGRRTYCPSVAPRPRISISTPTSRMIRP